MLCCYIHRGAINLKKILSIDFSTGSKSKEGTGYAFRDKEGKLIVGSIKPYTKGSTMKSRTLIIVEELEEIILRYELQDYDICIERPILAGNSAGSIELAQWNGYALGKMHALTKGYIYNIRNSKWCAYHLIKGKRKERKDASCELYERVMGEPTKDDNKADALAQLLYCEEVDYKTIYEKE